MNSKKTLEKKLAKLESINDQLVIELHYINTLMQLIGFSGGTETLKKTALELYEQNQHDEEDEQIAS